MNSEFPRKIMPLTSHFRVLSHHPSVDVSIHPGELGSNSSTLFISCQPRFICAFVLTRLGWCKPRLNAFPVCSRAQWDALVDVLACCWVYLLAIYIHKHVWIHSLPPAISRSAGASGLTRCLWLLQTVSVMDIVRDAPPSRGKHVHRFWWHTGPWKSIGYLVTI